MSQKCILIALHRFEVGGAETQALYLARYLQEKGYQVHVGAFGDETGLGIEKFTQAGISTLHWGFQEKLLLNPEPTLKGGLIKLKYLFKLIKSVKTLSPDIIISFTYPPNVIFGRWKKWFNCTKVFWNQRDISIGFTGHPWEEFSLRNTDVFISNSETGAKYIEEKTDCKVHVIPNYIDAYQFKNSRDFEKSDLLKVLMIGNIHANKNHIRLLDDWKDVVKIIPNARLLLAGKFGNEYEKCLNFINEHGLSEYVFLLGQVKDMIGLIEECQIAVFYSHGEGMPNGILEPMAAGLPVLVHRYVWSEELLGKDYPYFLSDQDQEGLVDRIKLMSKKDLIQIGKQNKERAKEKFGIDKSLNPYLDLINEY